MEKNKKIIKWFNKLGLDICLLCKNRANDGGCYNSSAEYEFYENKKPDTLDIKSCDSIKIKYEFKIKNG